ncbi:MAG TPA: hypothetical protein VHW92_02175 [Mycobacteriales bacterium]|nr:hypothetical protein [Mycobacteriales bacterium]
MLWIGIDVALAVLGLLVLAGLTFRLWRQVRQLGRDVSAAGSRIAEASEQLSAVAPERH